MVRLEDPEELPELAEVDDLSIFLLEAPSEVEMSLVFMKLEVDILILVFPLNCTCELLVFALSDDD